MKGLLAGVCFLWLMSVKSLAEGGKFAEGGKAGTKEAAKAA